MKPRTYTDEYYATKTWKAYEDQRGTIQWDIVMIWVVALALVALFWTWALSATDDFTDTGVGCIEDCLDPADTDVEAITWQA